MGYGVKKVHQILWTSPKGRFFGKRVKNCHISVYVVYGCVPMKVISGKTCNMICKSEVKWGRKMPFSITDLETWKNIEFIRS